MTHHISVIWIIYHISQFSRGWWLHVEATRDSEAWLVQNGQLLQLRDNSSSPQRICTFVLSRASTKSIFCGSEMANSWANAILLQAITFPEVTTCNPWNPSSCIRGWKTLIRVFIDHHFWFEFSLFPFFKRHYLPRIHSLQPLRTQISRTYSRKSKFQSEKWRT